MIGYLGILNIGILGDGKVELDFSTASTDIQVLVDIVPKNNQAEWKSLIVRMDTNILVMYITFYVSKKKVYNFLRK